MDSNHQWLPNEVTFEHFKTVFDVMNFTESLKQTFVIQLLSAGFEIFVCSFIAYGFARFDFKGKKIASFF